MTAPPSRPTPEHYEAALAAIDTDELVDLSLELAQIDSPPGQEQPVSDRVREWLDDNGIEASQVGMFADRSNVVGRLRGSGGGNTVIFNAHMDVAWGPEERRWMHDPDNPIYTSAWREGDTLVGNGLINDKGPLACTLIAAKAVAASGAPLAGDLIGHGRRRRDRPGARRRVHLPRVPVQGGRRPLPHHARHHRGLRRGGRGHQLRRHLGGGRQGLLQGDRAGRQFPVHAVCHPPRQPRRARQRPGARSHR